jgi:hypothetical protein
MVDEVVNSYRLTLEYLRRLVEDVPDDDFARHPNGLANHPAWIVGHLTYSCQALGGELGLSPWLPAEWEAQFGTGSVPTSDRSAYPPQAQLLDALADGERRVSSRLRVIGDGGMAAGLPDQRHRTRLPTIGHAVVHILAGHTAVHVGQLVAWRRAAGYPALSEASV